MGGCLLLHQGRNLERAFTVWSVIARYMDFMYVVRPDLAIVDDEQALRESMDNSLYGALDAMLISAGCATQRESRKGKTQCWRVVFEWFLRACSCGRTCCTDTT